MMLVSNNFIQKLLSKESAFVAILCLSLLIFALEVDSSAILERQGSEENNDISSTGSDESWIGLYTMFGGGNPKFTPDGSKLIEGDIVIDKKDEKLAMNHRKATPDSSVYWPNGEVVYTYHESITQNEMNVIEAAMNHWRQNTCITFRRRSSEDNLFIQFRSDTQGCWSLVGRQMERYGQGQDVSIGLGCANLNVVVHEIGHVIGFYHEQSRSDRDSAIEIVWENVLPGFALQFRKESDSSFGIPYDLTSTMQYPQWAFSKEIFEKSTIVARNPAYQRFLSKNYPLSFRDRMLANQMYQCTSACSSSGSCSNGGYMRTTGSSYGGKSCSCDCPPNFTGANCETQIRPDYYEDLPCGGVVNQEGVIQTPNYPHRYSPGESCAWDIRAPAGKQVSIKFDGFEFAPRFTKAGTKVINKCFNETVEIRLKNGYDGSFYCGNDIAPGTIIRSEGSQAVIIITANDKMIGSGLRAGIRFLSSGESEETNPATQEPPTHTVAPVRPPGPGPDVFTPPPNPWKPPHTPSSLLEEYEIESKKTLPPVMPY